MQVARAASAALDAVSSSSEEWATSVQRLKFEAHNREWLQMVRLEQQQQQQDWHQQGSAGDSGAAAAPAALCVF